MQPTCHRARRLQQSRRRPDRELGGQFLDIANAELVQALTKPRPARLLEVAGDLLDFTVGVIAELADRVDERAAAKICGRKRAIEPVESAQDLIGRRLVGRRR